MKIVIRVRIGGQETQQLHNRGNTLVLPSSAFSVLEETTQLDDFGEVTHTAELCGTCKTPWCKGECV